MPVALNLYKIREAKDAGGEFFRSVYRQKSQYQGLWVVSPSGQVLASHQETGNLSDWTKKVLADLEAGCRAFGEIKPRRAGPAEALPYRGAGVRPDGRVTLAVIDKVIVVKDLSRDLPRDAIGPTVLDSLTLAAAEWLTLAPPEARPGNRWSIPEPVARKFFPVLNLSDTTFRAPEEVTSVRMSAAVESVRGGIARLTYEGRIAGVHRGTENEARKGQECSGEAKLVAGVGSYDIRAGKMISLNLVWDGRFRNYPPYDDPPSRFGAVVEWRASP